MELWILKPQLNLAKDDDPWEPWYDKAFGFVVRAETEKEARQLANNEAGEENKGEFLGETITTPWLDSKYSSCNVLTRDGMSEVIISDFRSA